jgi:predicted  nucleic acid-binding Zn-ribbon protein
MIAGQMRLPGIDPPQQLHPSAERAAPAFWVRRIRILRELKAGDEHVVRDVELRRGLNIVWAAHHSAGADNKLFRDGVAGHTAGKSTFCRLLRHVLGDGGFAPDGVKRRIRSKLPTAWVAAEVVVGDVPWVVARPLGIGRSPFCLRDGSIDDVTDENAERLDYQEFVDALAGGTMALLASTQFPSTDKDKPVAWAHVLPWLIRDQDCRFADFVEWRHSGSGSEAPALNAEERQFLVRTVLGLISDDERKELQRNAQLVADKEEATRTAPMLRHQAETDRQRLINALGKDLPLTSTPLFASAARAELDARREDLRKRTEVLKAGDQREQLQAAVEAASKKEGELKQKLTDVQERLDGVQGVVGELAGTQQSGLLAALPPPRGFCNVPLRVAREHNCPLVVNHPADLAAKRSEVAAKNSEQVAVEELAAERRIVAALQQEKSRIEREIEAAERTTKNARRNFLSANTAYTDATSKLRDEGSKLHRIGELIDGAEGAAKDAASKADSIKQLAKDIEESYAHQMKIREAQETAIGLFSARFDYVVRALIGDHVLGRVDTSGRSLALTVEEHGERDSTFIATMKVLSFDLAAVLASIEGHGAFPRFLVHDGPREADMAPDVYERLFLLAEEVEKCFKGEPAFQYIVTTTTTPPEKFIKRDAPWLRLQLSGLPAQERLLRQDL